MKNLKKILSLLLILSMMLTVLASCGSGDNGDDTDTESESASDSETETDSESESESETEEEIVDPYTELSAELYDEILGEFADAYAAAKEETNVSKRQALMAVAEAKLMASAVMLPLSTNGGMYAISRVVPYTATSTLWGNDSYRYHDVIVCNEPIKSADRAAMKAKWAELKGTGTYEEWVLGYLADNGYTTKDTYSIAYSSDPKTWDVLATSRAADSEAIVNTYDGLLEYDIENQLKPALAESYEVSEDGLTYTFHIREGVKWVDYQGNVLADVTADDFVAGMQHMMDAQGGLEYLIEGIIVNATEYIDGEVDIDEVGVKAVDTYTLQYTLEAPTSFFITMLGYGVFAPMNREYYASQGGQFGADYDAEAEDYSYGKTPNNIAYCGPYLVTNNTATNKIVFSANESYWNAANINVKTLNWLYNDGQEATKAYNDMKAGTIDGCSLNASALELARSEKVSGTDTTWYDAYYYVSATDATSFMAFYNVNRSIFTNFNDTTKVVSTLTAEDHERATAAMQNVHFRRAISFALDRGAYNAQIVGEELKLTSLRNCYTPGNFISLAEETTIKINGTDKTYAAGTWYGEIMQDQLNADGVKIKVWDPEADDGNGSSDGFDGWYNVENAVEELNAAIAELAEDGIEVSATNPIKIELPYYSAHPNYAARAQAYKQSLEAALEGKVQLVLIGCDDSDDWYYAGYYTNYGYDANYDIYDVSGWGPDYGDPQTYLDTFLADYAGYMVKCIGIY